MDLAIADEFANRTVSPVTPSGAINHRLSSPFMVRYTAR